MTLKDLHAQLDRLGFAPVLLETTSEDGLTVEGPVMITLETDHMDRARPLLIETSAGAAGDPVAFVHFRVVYPTLFEDEDGAAEAVRAICLLNRTLPIGHNGFCEETPGAYFAYTATVAQGALPPDAVLAEIVGMVDHFSAWHGRLIDMTAEGAIGSAEVVAELRRRGLRPRPLVFGGTEADAADEVEA